MVEEREWSGGEVRLKGWMNESGGVRVEELRSESGGVEK